jgi:hypothetical protein
MDNRLHLLLGRSASIHDKQYDSGEGNAQCAVIPVRHAWSHRILQSGFSMMKT